MIATSQAFLFEDLGPRRVQADFSGGTLSTDAGALLLRQVDANLGLAAELAQCFYDTRNQYLGGSFRGGVASPAPLWHGSGLRGHQ